MIANDHNHILSSISRNGLAAGFAHNTYYTKTAEEFTPLLFLYPEVLSISLAELSLLPPVL